VEQHLSVMICWLNMEDLMSKDFCRSVSNKDISDVLVYMLLASELTFGPLYIVIT
jgi:hypothetical protein